MAGFRSVRELVISADNGAHRVHHWRKVPTQTTASGSWFDLSMSPGVPSPQYYASSPLAARAMSNSDGGLFHGAAVAPERKMLRKLMAFSPTATVAPSPMILLDYLLFYPFIDEGGSSPQIMTNIETLPRYTDGVGVQIMPVIVAAGSGGAGVTFECSYTNSEGVSGRTTKTVSLCSQTVNGTVATTASATNSCNGPFIPLQDGDRGVRSIQSVTFNGVTDVGLITLVLVKPLAQLSIRETGTPVEIDYLIDFSQIPEIKDTAYLNFIIHPAGTLSGATLMGLIETTWG